MYLEGIPVHKAQFTVSPSYLLTAVVELADIRARARVSDSVSLRLPGIAYRFKHFNGESRTDVLHAHRIIRRIHSLLKAFGSYPGMYSGWATRYRRVFEPTTKCIHFVRVPRSRIDHLDYVPRYKGSRSKNTTVESGIYPGKKSAE